MSNPDNQPSAETVRCAELLPCPYCGGKAYFTWTLDEIKKMLPEWRYPGNPRDGGTYLTCCECNATMFHAVRYKDDQHTELESFEERYAELMARWNRRVSPPMTEAEYRARMPINDPRNSEEPC